MQNALRELRKAGLIIAQQGRAYFVRDPGRPVAAGTDSERLPAAVNELRERSPRSRQATRPSARW
jgi:DNA-binding transcriptional regulator YhcF (GntR family)